MTLKVHDLYFFIACILNTIIEVDIWLFNKHIFLGNFLINQLPEVTGKIRIPELPVLPEIPVDLVAI